MHGTTNSLDRGRQPSALKEQFEPVFTKLHNPTSLSDLKQAIKQVWMNEISVNYCEKLCLSMPERIDIDIDIDMYLTNKYFYVSHNLVKLLSAAPLRVATADISAQKIWQCFTPDALPDAAYS